MLANLAKLLTWLALPGKQVGSPFKLQNYGIALPINSPYRKSVNFALLNLMENGTYNQIKEKWFGTQQ
ncbi:MAG: transporter substrate-binding domain-containing protein [Xenococcaceae cyanobacterium]